MTWSRTHQRNLLVHAVLDDIAATGQPAVPAPLRADVDDLFGDFGTFLREVQFRWHRSFTARLDAVLRNDPPDMRAALVQLWHGLTETMPAARLLLDAHGGHPALAKPDHDHQSAVYAATGIHLESVLIATPPSNDRELARLPLNTCTLSQLPT